MRVVVLTVTLYVSWVHSLKEKCMEIKSLLQRLCNKFNVSACETSEQDMIQTLVISVVSIAANPSQADSIADNILAFMKGSTEAEVTAIDRQIY